MKRALLGFIMLCMAVSVSAQQRLAENFDYPVGDSLGAHGWTSFSGGATNRLLVTSPGLSYAGYPLSGIGNATTLTTTGQDAYTPFTSSADTTNAKAVYAFFLVNVSSVQNGGDYFLAFLPSTSTTFYSARVFARSDGAGGINFGIVKSSPQDTLNTGMWTTSGYSLNTTYLLVSKYEFRPGASNDAVSLFVFSSGLPMTEPAPTVGPIVYTSGDAFNLGRIALRQGTSTKAPGVTVDGILATTSWFTTVLNVKLAVQGLYNEGTGQHSISDSVTIYLRNNTTPYAIVDSSTAVVDKVSLRGLFEFANVTSGNYYMDVRYRKSPAFRNGVTTWSRTGGEALTQYNGFSYDFTDAANKAYGDNQLLKGAIYVTFNGDVNQDGTVDASDASAVDNDISNFASGYLNTDLNGDEFIDASDAAVTDNNAFNFVGSVTP
jgi:hypothetical protein